MVVTGFDASFFRQDFKTMAACDEASWWYGSSQRAVLAQ